jgi:hypothetical protein
MSARDRRDEAEMRTEDVLTYRPIVLTEAQRAAYFSDGFLILPNYVPRTWLERLCAANDELGAQPARRPFRQHFRTRKRGIRRSIPACIASAVHRTSIRLFGSSCAIRS